MNKKYQLISSVVFLLLIIVSINNSFGQVKVKEKKKLSEKIFFGGSIGMVFGTVTRIDILPEVGIWVLPQWSIGAGGRYTYRRERYNLISGESQNFKSHIWGLSGFTQIMPIPDLDKAFKIGIHGGPIFQGEWEGLYLDKGNFDPNITSQEGRGWVHLFLVGVGYRFPVSEKSGINLLVLWELTNSRYTPYTTNPLLRLSVNF